MTKITVYDTYLHKNITFFVNRKYNNKEDVEKELRISSYLYFPVAAVEPASRLERLFVRMFCRQTKYIEDALFCNYKYLIINED